MDKRERRARVSEQAAEWLLRSQHGTLSRAEQGQFVDWLRESSLHVEETLRVAQLHGALVDFAGWDTIAPGIPEAASITRLPQRMPGRPDALPTPIPQARTARRFSFPALTAAAICAVAALSLWFLPRLGQQVIDTDFTERREVTLADGSHLQIAPGTRLRISLEAKRRRIVLERGRAVFRVAKDAARPFLVEADRTIVRAVGTAFGVEIERDGVTVTVSHGRIAVTAQDGIAFIDSGRRNMPAVTVIAGEQVAVRAGRLTAVHSVDVNRALAWADNRLVLQNDTVAEAARLFNNTNPLKLRIVDGVLAARRITGVFDASDPQSFVAFLDSDQSRIVTESRGNELIIRRAAENPVSLQAAPSLTVAPR